MHPHLDERPPCAIRGRYDNLAATVRSMDWGDASWWWENALDGIVAGLVGGLVTGAAVWATIRHERRQTADQDLRQHASQLHAFVVRSIFSPPDESDIDAWSTWIGDTYALILAVEVRADAQGATVLAGEMNAVQDHVMAAFDERPVPHKVDRSEMLLGHAAGDADRYAAYLVSSVPTTPRSAPTGSVTAASLRFA